MIGLEAFGRVLPTMSVSPSPSDCAPMRIHLCVYTSIRSAQVVGVLMSYLQQVLLLLAGRSPLPLVSSEALA